MTCRPVRQKVTPSEIPPRSHCVFLECLKKFKCFSLCNFFVLRPFCAKKGGSSEFDFDKPVILYQINLTWKLLWFPSWCLRLAEMCALEVILPIWALICQSTFVEILPLCKLSPLFHTPDLQVSANETFGLGLRAICYGFQSKLFIGTIKPSIRSDMKGVMTYW